MENKEGVTSIVNNSVWDKLLQLGKENAVTLRPVVAQDLVFEENVRLNCFYCARYGRNWRCPPRIPALDYIKIFSEFDNRAFVYRRYEITPQNKNSIRMDSTNHLHKTLLTMEKLLYENGRSTALAFIGGSCKLCKNGCGADRCNNPYASRIPLEATGMNVERSAAKYDIEITWPVEDSFLRLGMLLW